MAEPTVTNLNNIINRIAGLLGIDQSDPSGAMLSQIVTNWLKQNIVQPVTGISPNDPLWNATLYTNMTDFGVMMQGLNSQANSLGIQNMMQLQASARYQLLEGWQRTATSQETFNQLVASGEAGGFTDYNAFIQHKTQGMMDNPIISAALQMWDPTGKLMASAYMRQASSNIAREAMWRGDRDFREQADAVANVFLDEQKKIAYDKRDYGQMTLNESSAVLAALTRNRGLADFAPEQMAGVARIREQIRTGGDDRLASGENIEDLMRQASDRLRERLKGLTQAMSPLKDFFGDDVPNMIRFLEEISGKSFEELGNGAVSDITRRVTSSLSTGIYTAKQMQAVSNSLNQTLGQMNTGFYMEPASLTIADTMLSTVNAGITPALMNDESFRQSVSERLIRHAASPFANSINLAYSAWKASGGLKGEDGTSDTSMETFQQLYQNLRTKTDDRDALTAEAAMLQLSGASSVNQMYDIGYRNLGYTEAAQSGLGARMANAEGTHERISRYIAGLGSEADQNAVRGIYEYLVTNREAGLTLDAAIRNIESWGDSDDAGRRSMYEMWNTINQSSRLQPLMTDMRIMGNQVDVQHKTTNADLMRKRSQFINDLFQTSNASNALELVQSLVLTEERQKPEIKARLNELREKAGITNLANTIGITDEDITSIETLMKMADTDERKIELAREYMLSIGPTGENRQLLNPYIKAYAADDSEENKAALALAIGMSPEALKAFESADLATDKNDMGRTLREFAKGLAENPLERKEGESDEDYERRKGTWEAAQIRKKAAGLTYQYSESFKAGKSEVDRLLKQTLGEKEGAIQSSKLETFLKNGEIDEETKKVFLGDVQKAMENSEVKPNGSIQDIRTAIDSLTRDIQSATPSVAQAAGTMDTSQLLTQLLGDGHILQDLTSAINSLTGWLEKHPEPGEKAKVTS